jgi:hypothetical protein
MVDADGGESFRRLSFRVHLDVSSAEFADADMLRPNVPTFDETWFRLAARLFAGFLPLMPNAVMNRVS